MWRTAACRKLLYLGFLVDDVLAYHRIVFLHLQLAWRGALVLGGCVVVPGSGTGYKLDLVPHCSDPLYLFAPGAQAGQHRIDTLLVNDAHPLVGNSQLHPAVFAFYPESMRMQVGQETPPGLIVGVRNIVSRNGPFPRDLAYLGHFQRFLY